MRFIAWSGVCSLDNILRSLHHLYLNSLSGLASGIVVGILGLSEALLGWYLGELSSSTAASVGISLGGLLLWVRSHFVTDGTNSGSSYGSSCLYLAAWVSLVGSEVCLFLGSIGPSVRDGISHCCASLESVILSAKSLLGLLVGQGEASSTALGSVNSAILWGSGVCAVHLLLEWQRSSPSHLVALFTGLLVASGLFVTVQAGEFQNLGWSLSSLGYATSFYLLTGLHGSHVLAGHIINQLLVLQISLCVSAAMGEVVSSSGLLGPLSY
jgi:heme/copper-type cytochrome/quinol oxidase subunit 3